MLRHYLLKWLSELNKITIIDNLQRYNILKIEKITLWKTCWISFINYAAHRHRPLWRSRVNNNFIYRKRLVMLCNHPVRSRVANKAAISLCLSQCITEIVTGYVAFTPWLMKLFKLSLSLGKVVWLSTESKDNWRSWYKRPLVISHAVTISSNIPETKKI